MLIECDDCVTRGATCGECVVSVVLEAPSGAVRPAGRVEFDDAEWRAVSALVDAGLLPRLRLVSRGDPPPELPGMASGTGAGIEVGTVVPLAAPAPAGGRSRAAGQATPPARRRPGAHHRVRRVA